MALEPLNTTVRSVKDRGSVKNFLVVLQDGGVVTHRLPDSGEVTVGRSDDADVTIQHPSISRHHATLTLGERVTVCDLGSSNGTTVRDQQLVAKSPTEIAINEVFVLGDVSVVLQRRQPTVRTRRVWSHDYFEGRVAEECAKVGKSEGGFAILHIAFDKDGNAPEVQEAIFEHLEEADVLARFGPKDYEVFVADAQRLDTLAQRIGYAFSARSVGHRLGSACFPEHGKDVDKLLGRARTGSETALTTGPRGRQVVLEDDVMKNLYRLAERIAKGTINVLILGETGVGKQVLAEAIHRYSPRRDKPFVELNCSAFSETLLESELFGHEKGAFTGADKAKTGLLESASGGTVFLDEIGDMGLPLQAKLLRALENQEVLPVGGLKPRKIDVRFVAATNRDLEEESRAGNFRQDLYFRINGVTLEVPPLRERTREIAALAQSFAADYAKALGHDHAPAVSAGALDLLVHYSWPGNIRELRNAMERAVLLAGPDEIALEHLPVEKMQASVPALGTGVREAPALSGSESDEEKKQKIWETLMACGGNNTEAAKLLGVSRRTLGKWLENYGLPRPRKQRKTDDPDTEA